MKKLSALLVVLALIIGIGSSYAQPKFTLQLHGGYSMPMAQLKGDLPTDSAGFMNLVNTRTDDNTYYMKTGFNFGLTGKYAFGKKGNVRLTFGGDYKMFNNSTDVTLNLFGTGSGVITVEPKMNIIALNIGGEYAVTGKSKFTPYFGLDLTANIIGGETKYSWVPTSGTGFDSTFKYASATRFGIGVGAGFEYAFSKQVGLNFGIKYNMMNLIGKDADTTIDFNTTVEQPLNDKEFTDNNISFAARNIADLQIYLGASFYFGQPKATVKK